MEGLNKFPICTSNDATSEEKLQRCHKCAKTFPTSQQLLQHSLVHSNVRKFLCSYCDKSFKQLSHLQQHQRIHTGERPYCCVINGCTKAFRQLSSLQQHLKGHGFNRRNKYEFLNDNKKSETSFIAKPYDLICQICDKKCINSQSFFDHMYKHHPNYWTSFSDGLPESRLSTPNSSSFRKDNLYLCSICNKRYIHRTGYIKHISNHSIKQANTCSTIPITDKESQAQEQVFAEDFYLIHHLHVKADFGHKALEDSDKILQYKNNRKLQTKSFARQQPSLNKSFLSDTDSAEIMPPLIDKDQKLDHQFVKEQENQNYLSYSHFHPSFQVQYSRSLDMINQEKTFLSPISLGDSTSIKNQIREIHCSRHLHHSSYGFEDPVVFENGFGESNLNCIDMPTRFIRETIDPNQSNFSPGSEILNSRFNGSFQVATASLDPYFSRNLQDELTSAFQHFSK